MKTITEGSVTCMHGKSLGENGMNSEREGDYHALPVTLE